MDFQHSATWHARRQELFAKRDGSPLVLDSLTIQTIADELPSMEFDAAMRALETYRAAKPYKGFWWQTYLQHYATAKTDTTPKRGAALLAVDMNALLANKARQEQAYEIEQYRKIPEQFKQECRKDYAEWGIYQSDDERAWRIVVLDAYLGYDVERYRIDKREKLGKPREQANPYTIIEGLRLQVAKLEAELKQANQAT